MPRRPKRRRRPFLPVIILLLAVIVGVIIAMVSHNRQNGEGNPAVTTQPPTTTSTAPPPNPSTPDGALALQVIREYESNPNGDGEKYWEWAQYDEEVSWCAIFISYCADRAGLLDRGVMTSSVYASASDFHLPYHSANVYTPHTGDIIIYDFDNQRKYSDDADAAQDGEHVGVVISVDTESGMVTVIEGNGTLRDEYGGPVINGKLVQRTVPLAWPFIKGYACPSEAFSENLTD